MDIAVQIKIGIQSLRAVYLRTGFQKTGHPLIQRAAFRLFFLQNRGSCLLRKRLARSAFPILFMAQSVNPRPSVFGIQGKTQNLEHPVKHRDIPDRFFDRHLKGDSVLGEHLLQYPGLVLKPVKNSYLPEGDPLLHQPPDPIRKITGLLKGIIVVFYHDFVSSLPAAGKPAAVLRESARCLKNRFAGTIIYRQGQFHSIISRPQGIKHIAGASPPAVNHLIGIPNGKKRRPLVHQPLNQTQLQGVAVLYLINNHPLRLPFRTFQQLLRVKKKIGKAHPVSFLFFFLQRFLKERHIVLNTGTVSSRGTCRLLFQSFFQTVFVFDLQLSFPNQFQRQIQLLFRVHHLEISSIAQLPHRQDLPQKLKRHAVKGAEIPHIRQIGSFFRCRQPLFYLICCLIGKGEHHHVPVAYIRRFMEIPYFHRKDRGFAAPHIGIDKAGAAFVQHRLPLILIQITGHHKLTHEILLFPASFVSASFPPHPPFPSVGFPASDLREPGYNSGKYSEGCYNYSFP